MRFALAVDAPHLHWLGLGCQQRTRGGFGVERDAMRAAEIVEGALRDHPHRAAAGKCGLRHRVDRAVAAGRNHRTAVLTRQLHGTRNGVAQAARLVGHQQFEAAAG